MARKLDQESEVDPLEEPNPETYVGYGCPPKHTQFKPGVCPNPRGRPKRARGRRQILIKIIGEYCEVRVDGKIQQLSLLAVILIAVRNATANGNPQARKTYDWLLSEEIPEEDPVQKGVLIVGEKLTPEEWEARYCVL
jgi:hypothetical protein